MFKYFLSFFPWRPKNTSIRGFSLRQWYMLLYNGVPTPWTPIVSVNPLNLKQEQTLFNDLRHWQHLGIGGKLKMIKGTLEKLIYSVQKREIPPRREIWTENGTMNPTPKRNLVIDQSLIDPAGSHPEGWEMKREGKCKLGLEQKKKLNFKTISISWQNKFSSGWDPDLAAPTPTTLTVLRPDGFAAGKKTSRRPRIN